MSLSVPESSIRERATTPSSPLLGFFPLDEAASYSVRMDGPEDEIRRLRWRLAEVQRLHHEAWLSGLSMGGGLGAHEQQTLREDEARSIEARLVELGAGSTSGPHADEGRQPVRMSAPQDESDLRSARQRRSIRRSTILWSVVVVGLVMFAAGNWTTLAIDGGGSTYTWSMAIGGSVVAAATGVFIATFRHATRDLRRPDADPRAEE